MIDYELLAAKRLQESLRAASGWMPSGRARGNKPGVPLRAIKRTPPDLWHIAHAIMCEVSNAIPDCDPLDMLVPALARMDIDRKDTIKWLDKATRKHLGHTCYNNFLIEAWEGWNEVCEPDQRMDNPWGTP